MKKDYILGLSEEGFHRIAYTEWGIPNPKPILCIHGLTRNGRDFDALARYLSERQNQVFCPDIVGRGDSDWLKNPLHYTYEQYIADMNAMIARMGAKSIDVIGTSMGGLIGMIMASFPNSPVRKLVLNDIGPQIPVKAIARLSQYAGKDPEFNSKEEAVNYFKSIYADFGNLSDAEWEEFTHISIREIGSGRYTTKLDQGIKRSQAKSKLAWKLLLSPHKALEGTLFDVDLWQIWRKVTCPVLVIHGKKSDLLLPNIIQKMQAIHPQTEVLEIEDAGHAPALLHPSQHAAIEAWLRMVK